MARLQSPLDGKPATRHRRDKSGRSSYCVRLRYHTPLRAKVLHKAKKAIFAALTVFVGYATYRSGFDLWTGVRLGIQASFSYLLTGWVLSVLLRRSALIDLSEDTIITSGLLRSRRFDRRTNHIFMLLQHDKAAAEGRRLELETAAAQLKGRAVRPQPYYADSYHVILVYGTRRIDLVTVYGIKDANALLNRLVYCDGLLNQAIGRSGGYNEGSADWGQRGPGGI